MSCKGCRKRHPACQDSCEQYKTEQAHQKAWKEKIKAAKGKEAQATDTVIRLAEIRRRKYAK